MLTQVDYLVGLERRKDLLAEVEEHRLRRQVPRRSSSVTAEAYRRLRARLGEWLVGWGQRLQARDVTRVSLSGYVD